MAARKTRPKLPPGECGCGALEGSCSDPDPVSGWDAPAWQASTIYDVDGTSVTFGGKLYTNRWYTSGAIRPLPGLKQKGWQLPRRRFTSFEQKEGLEKNRASIFAGEFIPPASMRFFLLLLSSIIISGCVAPKKVDELKALHADRVALLENGLKIRNDSIVALNSSLDRALGGNELLLTAQSNLEDKLVTQKDQIDALSGNLNQTSSRMSAELAKTRRELEAAKLKYDTLLLDQQSIITSFQEGVTRAETVLMNSLEANIPDESYRINVSAGEVRLSVQEDLLFEDRKSEELNEEAGIVLRGVLDALQSDPLLKLIIIGHTDNQPNPRRNTNNWEYAALRATFLAAELADTYYLSPNRVIAATHGEFGPTTSNATPEGQKANRRVDFVLRNNVGNLLRNFGKLGKE